MKEELKQISLRSDRKIITWAMDNTLRVVRTAVNILTDNGRLTIQEALLDPNYRAHFFLHARKRLP